jgi:glutamine synthetase
MADINGLLRCKRIHRREFDTLYSGNFKAPLSVPLLGILGDLYDEAMDRDALAGDPDQLLLPLSGTTTRVPWLSSPTAQVMTCFADMALGPSWADPREALTRVLQRYDQSGLKPVVATELEFYLLAPGEGDRPRPLRGVIPGTGLKQQGIQYCMADDLLDCDAFLDDVRTACDLQGVPLTAIHSEFAAGQWEINTHHSDAPLLACDQAMLLKRIVKAVARRHGMGATFMAKPFAELAGNGMHIHASVYDCEGNNIFGSDSGGSSAGGDTTSPESESGAMPVSENLRHAIGGLVDTMEQAMAILAPNANSYRRFRPGTFAPSSPSWGYNHREVALRIPVSSDHNRRIEHRVAGADANPYLVTAAVLAGLHHGLQKAVKPGPAVAPNADLSSAEVTLPQRWETALQAFRAGTVLPAYLGETYCRAFAAQRQGECDHFHAQVSNIDYEWYLRAL